MVTSLFVSHDALMQLEAAGELELAGESITVRDERQRYGIEPALRFLQVLSGADEASLLGKVHTVREILDMGAEHYQDSVLVGEVAYQVEEGFLGTPSSGAGEPSEGELFAQFLTEQE